MFRGLCRGPDLHVCRPSNVIPRDFASKSATEFGLIIRSALADIRSQYVTIPWLSYLAQVTTFARCNLRSLVLFGTRVNTP